MLLEEITLLLEAEDLKREVQKAAMKATDMPISFRAGAAQEIYVVVDGSARGRQGADDHELVMIMKKIESEIESPDHPVERLYDSRDDAERPTGLQIFSKKSTGRYPVLRVKFVKKSIPRLKSDGDPKKEHVAFKILSRTGKPGENNELHFVKILNKIIEDAGGLIKELVFDGYTNDRSHTFKNIVSAKWVGNKNTKADALLVNDDGEIFKISLKQRNFFEINAGEEFYHRNEKQIQSYLDQAVDTAQINIDDEGKFTKERHFEIAAKLSKTEAKDAYFGKDQDEIQAVIVETFLVNDFHLTGSKLTIHCDYVLDSVDDIHDRLWPYLAINSDFEKDPKRSSPVYGKTFLNIVPRFRLKSHPRKSTKYPKTLIINR